MRCTEVRKRLAEYQLGGLDEAQREQIAAHLRECDECRAELRALERLDGLLVAVEPMEAPSGLWERVRARMKPRRRGVREWWRASARPALALAAAVLVAAVGLWLALRGPAGEPPAGTLAADYQEPQIVAEWSQPLADDAALGVAFASLNGAEDEG